MIRRPPRSTQSRSSQRQMCIRDRICSSQAPRSRPKYHRQNRSFISLQALTPVSYTHLRAHETRHELLCRLLLEKKKKTISATPLKISHVLSFTICSDL